MLEARDIANPHVVGLDRLGLVQQPIRRAAQAMRQVGGARGKISTALKLAHLALYFIIEPVAKRNNH